MRLPVVFVRATLVRFGLVLLCWFPFVRGTLNSFSMPGPSSPVTGQQLATITVLDNFRLELDVVFHSTPDVWTEVFGVGTVGNIFPQMGYGQAESTLIVVSTTDAEVADKFKFDGIELERDYRVVLELVESVYRFELDGEELGRKQPRTLQCANAQNVPVMFSPYEWFECDAADCTVSNLLYQTWDVLPVTSTPKPTTTTMKPTTTTLKPSSTTPKPTTTTLKPATTSTTPLTSSKSTNATSSSTLPLATTSTIDEVVTTESEVPTNETKSKATATTNDWTALSSTQPTTTESNSSGGGNDRDFYYVLYFLATIVGSFTVSICILATVYFVWQKLKHTKERDSLWIEADIGDGHVNVETEAKKTKIDLEQRGAVIEPMAVELENVVSHSSIREAMDELLDAGYSTLKEPSGERPSEVTAMRTLSVYNSDLNFEVSDDSIEELFEPGPATDKGVDDEMVGEQSTIVEDDMVQILIDMQPEGVGVVVADASTGGTHHEKDSGHHSVVHITAGAPPMRTIGTVE